MKMNRFKKFATNVWVAECEEEHKKGEIISLFTKYNKEVEVKIYNFLGKNNEKFLYSFVKIDNSNYATKKKELYEKRQEKKENLAKEWYEKSNEGRDFLRLGEPIKVGHHSEARHRALIERNYKRMGKSVEFSDKARKLQSKIDYWKKRENEITLAMPESLEFYTFKLEEATKLHKGLKDGTIEREHGYSLVYANNAVKNLTKKVELAQKLWG